MIVALCVALIGYYMGRKSWWIEKQIDTLIRQVAVLKTANVPTEMSNTDEPKAIIIDPDSIEYQVAMAKMEREEKMNKINK